MKKPGLILFYREYNCFVGFTMSINRRLKNHIRLNNYDYVKEIPNPLAPFFNILFSKSLKIEKLTKCVSVFYL